MIRLQCVADYTLLLTWALGYVPAIYFQKQKTTTPNIIGHVGISSPTLMDEIVTTYQLSYLNDTHFIQTDAREARVVSQPDTVTSSNDTHGSSSRTCYIIIDDSRLQQDFCHKCRPYTADYACDSFNTGKYFDAVAKVIES